MTSIERRNRENNKRLAHKILKDGQQDAPEMENAIPPTMNKVPVIQKLAYIHRIKIAKSPTIKSPGV